MSGFIKVSTDDAEFNIPYVGTPYSHFHTDYITYDPSSPLPRITMQLPGGEVIVNNSITINATTPYRSSVPRDQYTRLYRVDILPANTTPQCISL